MPWYRLRATYLADRSGYLQRNGGFLVPGYGCCAGLRCHLLIHLCCWDQMTLNLLQPGATY